MAHRFVPSCLALILLLALGVVPALGAAEGQCVGCHQGVTPGIVKDFESGRMAGSIDCSGCHGSAHHSAKDAGLAEMRRDLVDIEGEAKAFHIEK